MNWISALFKSRERRESERFKGEADAARKADAEKEKIVHAITLADRATKVINDFCDERAESVGIAMMEVYRRRIGETHTHTVAELAAEYLIFKSEMLKYDTQMEEEIYVALGELKYDLIEWGVRESSERYIKTKIQKLSEAMIEAAKEDLKYEYARVEGMLLGKDRIAAKMPEI